MIIRKKPRKAVPHELTGVTRPPRRRIKTFSLATEDEARLNVLQHRLSYTGRLVSESETVRAALYALLLVPDEELEALLESVPRLKPGPVRR